MKKGTIQWCVSFFFAVLVTIDSPGVFTVLQIKMLRQVLQPLEFNVILTIWKSVLDPVMTDEVRKGARRPPCRPTCRPPTFPA